MLETSARRVYLPLVALWMALSGAPKAGLSAQAGGAVQRVLVGHDSAGGSHLGGRVLARYETFDLLEVSLAELQALSPAELAGVTVRDDWHLLDLAHSPFDTRQYSEAPGIPDHLEQRAGADMDRLMVVQFIGPIKDEWLDELASAGVVPVHAFPVNAYLVWARREAVASLERMTGRRSFLQYAGPHHPFYKLSAELAERLSDADDSPEELLVTVQRYRGARGSETRDLVRKLSSQVVVPWWPILEYENTRIRIQSDLLVQLARQPDVVWLGIWHPPELHDAVQGQIVAGHLDPSRSGPSGPGYRAWLDSLGFSQVPGNYPIVDVVDDGLGNGTVNSADRTLHLLGDLANATRVAYVQNCTSEPDGGGPDGHGHINVSIAGGFDSLAGFPFRDPNGFQRGMGINPYGRVAGTRIFDAAGFDLSNCGGGSYADLIKASQDAGAAITSNSWGGSYYPNPGQYDVSSQAFDTGVRDADQTETGNQQLTMVFSSGNEGPAFDTIGTPANGKNVITVGASENDRPADEDGDFFSQFCGSGPSAADNAMDVADFSSRGPAPGGRVKPETIAPGVHVQGTASTHPSYNGTGVCDQYRPSGQTIFASSNGTSHSTPAVAGVASLYYYWLQNTHGIGSPSPALIKAYLLAHTQHLTGLGANDPLPSDTQGFGMPEMSTAFDGATRSFVDQTQIFGATGASWTMSGGIADSSQAVRIVLAFTDQAGALGFSPQVNDLDLEVTVGGTDIYLGNNFSGVWSATGGSADSANNYEAVYLPPGTSGTLSVKVTAANIAGDGVPGNGDATDQDFALVVYNGTSCTLPAAPTNLTATAAGFNRIDLDWDASATPGISEYRIFRATSISGPFDSLDSVTGATTAYSDTSVSGGTTYYYVVRAVIACESLDSNTATTMAFGDCQSAPSFAGLQSVTKDSTCVLQLNWDAATPACGSSVVYNVYRSTTRGFMPDSGNLLASCVTDTVFHDTSVANGVPYYYVVRAEDGTSGNGGFCNGGNEDGNTVEGSETAGLAPTVLYSEDFQGCTVGSLCNWLRGTFGGTVNDWQGVRQCSGNNIFRFGATTCTGNYRANGNAVAFPSPTPAITVPASAINTRLSFDHRFEFEPAWDGGILYLSLNASSFSAIRGSLLSGQRYVGDIPGKGLGGFTGTSSGYPTQYQSTVVELDEVCDSITGGSGGCAGETLYVGFNGYTDGSVHFDGWFLDNVVITAEEQQICSSVPSDLQFFTATATDGQNLLEWQTPASCDGVDDQVVIRYSTSSTPQGPSDGLAVGSPVGCASDSKGETTHSGLTNGTTHYYAAFVDNGAGSASPGKTVSARPFDNSGNVKWAYSAAASAMAPPGIGSVYAVANDRVFHSMNPGLVGGDWPSAWMPAIMNGPAQGRPPIVPVSLGGANKVAFLGSQDGRVYAVDAESGQELWSSPDLGDMVQAAPAGMFTGFGGAYDLIFAATRNSTSDNVVHGLNLADGSVAWSFDNGGGATGIGIISSQGSVDYANNRIYFASRRKVGGSSNTVWCLSFTDTGAALVWARDIGDSDGSAILDNGMLYVGTNAGEVHALDPDSGADVWPGPFQANDGLVKGYIWPRFGGTELFFSTTNKVWAISSVDGSMLWSENSVPGPSIPLYRPGSQYLVVGGSDGNLYQIDFSSTTPVVTSVTLGDGTAAVGSPALEVQTGMAYVGTDGGKVYAVELPLP